VAWFCLEKMGIMGKTISREIRLASRPQGMPGPQNFTMASVEVGSPQKGEVLVRNLFMSVDPYMRGRMREGKSYVPPFEIGKPLEGGAVGEVIESKADGFQPGDVVLSNFGWREYLITNPQNLRPVNRKIQPLSVYLGVLGMTGMTAWVGLSLAEAKAGETVFISGAAGAVGSAAGQLAKQRGCRVIGSAGSPEKTSFLLDECGLDVAFNYKTGSNLKHLEEAAPEGIDVYFDNVGGEALEAALTSLKVRGRIAACGAISMYNSEKPQPGPANLFLVVVKRLTIRGFIVSDWLDKLGDFQREAGELFVAGKLKHKETLVEGIENAADAFLGLFKGANIGKMVVKLGT
jgi:NADPH-dependent curcumin reductase CurA